jgi:hypothetical protein
MAASRSTRPIVTRFKQRDGGDGPVSGAIQLINIQLDTALATNTTVFRQAHFPAGMGFIVTDVEIFAGTVVAAVNVTVGDTAAGTQIVASEALATGSSELTIKDGTVDAGGLVDVRITSNTTGTMALPVSINVIGHVASPPTSVDP